MSTILYIQHTKFFQKCTQFCSFNVHDFSNNVHNLVFSRYSYVQTVYTIMYIQHT